MLNTVLIKTNLSQRGPGISLICLLLTMGNVIHAQHLLNIDFAGSTKKGPAAFGLSTNDYWNSYSFPFNTDASMTNLLWSDKSASGVNLRVQNAPGQWGNSTGDPMYDSYIYTQGGDIVMQLINLNAGKYDLYLYGHGAADNQNTSFSINGQTKATEAGPYWNNNQLVNGQWLENKHYVIFRSVTVTAGNPLLINASGANVNGLQLIPTEFGISQQPLNQQIPFGGTVYFNVGATNNSAKPLTFQWFFNDHPISGETNAQLIIKNVSNFYIGIYSVQVSNGAQSLMSDRVQLSIVPFALSIFTAVEVEFPTQLNKQYQLQLSPDLVTWTNFGDPISGTGQLVQKLISIRGSNMKYYQVLEQ